MFAGSSSFRSLWTPRNINTVLWLDAADSSSITTVSGAVSEWGDKSGNGRHVSQSTANSRPTYTTNGLNGLPILTFGGTKHLSNLLFPTNLTSINLFVVAKWTTTGTSFSTIQALIDNYHSSVPEKGFVLQDRPDLSNKPLTLLRIPFASGNFSGASDNAITGNNSWKILSGLMVSGGSDSLWVDGVQKGVYANGGAFNLQTRFTVGAWIDSFTGNTIGRFYQGTMSEVIIIGNNLHRERIEGYLAHKWGLTANLPANHPYKNHPPRGL